MPKIGIGNIIPDIANLPGQGGGSSFANTKSLDFDGNDDYLSLGVPTYLQSKQTVTVSMWVRFTAVGNNDYTELLNVGSSPPDLRLRIVPAGTSRRIEFGVLNSFARATDIDFSDLVSGTWYHIMGCWNNNLNDGSDAQIYLDGDMIFQGDTNITIPATITANMDIAGNGDWGPFNGNIDEIAIWDTDQRAEVSSVYNLGTPNDLSLLTTPPNDWYRMGENSTFSSQILMPENTNKDKVSNYSMEFDGIDDSITTTSSISGDITLSAWINCNGTYTAWQPRYPLSITPSHSGLPNATIGRLYKQGASLWVGLQMWDENGANLSTYTAQGVSLEGTGWKNLVWTFDNTTKQIYLYIDGVAQTWTHYGGVITTPYLTCPGYLYNSNLKMGTRVGYYFFDGLVDEVSTFNSIKAIGDIWDGSGQPTDLTGESGLVGYWKMGEEATYDAVASEWTVPDQIGSNDGTSANMDINDRTGNAPDSSNNALSYNMDAADIVEDVPPNP